jgi:hypothetical protein
MPLRYYCNMACKKAALVQKPVRGNRSNLCRIGSKIGVNGPEW